MTIVRGTRPGTRHEAAPRFGPAPTGSEGRSADAATILAIFVVLQSVLPSKLVMNGLPLSISAPNLVALGLGALWFCAQMTTTLGAAKGRNPVRTALFAFSCALIATYANAGLNYLPSDERSIGDHAMVILISMVLIGLAACDGVRSRERIQFLVRAVVAAGAFVAAVGMVQFLFAYDPTPHMRPPGMHFTSTDPLVLERSGLRRVSGTVAHPIEFGVLCAMLLPLAIHVASTSKSQGRRPTVWFGATSLIGMGLMFSVSRSAVLSAGCAGFVLFCGWTSRRRALMVAVAAAFLVFVRLISPGLLNVILVLFQRAGSDDSIRWRTHDYATAHELISQHLWFGRGVGTWWAPKHEVFDNQYLLTLVDSGVVGLATFMSILVATIYATLRVMYLCSLHASSPHAAADRDLALSLAATVSVLPLAYATFDFASYANVTSTFFLAAGLSGALLRVVVAEVRGQPVDKHAIM
jgi:O-antigen ligase